MFQAHHYLSGGKSDETYNLLNEIEKELNKLNDVESMTYSNFYRVKS